MLAAIARLLGIDTAIVRVGLYILLLVAAVGLYLTIKHIGAEEARIEAERRNNEAGIKGGEARLSRADCVRCGGVYHFDTGRCAGPPACFGD